MRESSSVVLAAATAASFESVLLEGALLWHGISVRGSNEHDPAVGPRDILVLFNRPAECRVEPDAPGPSTKPTILAGRYVTYSHVYEQFEPNESQVVVYGEPYATVAHLVRNPHALEGALGSALVGSLWNPDEFRHPSRPEGDSPYPILTSVGCNRTCGYCPVGATFSRIYGHDYGRRSRNSAAIAQDILEAQAHKAQRFVFLADQFLDVDPVNNGSLMELAADWYRVQPTRPHVGFTVGPLEVLTNVELLNAMAECFVPQIRLSVDSLSSENLRDWALDFDPGIALEAVNALVDLRIPFRLNYIFLASGTGRELAHELAYMASLADSIKPLDRDHQLLLACDLFSNALEYPVGAPVSELRALRVTTASGTRRAIAVAVCDAIELEMKSGAPVAGTLRRIVDAATRTAEILGVQQLDLGS
jgi:hypothetical protein